MTELTLLGGVLLLELVLLVLILSRRGQPGLGKALQEEFRMGREEYQKSARDLREEVSAGQGKSTETLVHTLSEMGKAQKTELAAVTTRIDLLSKSNEERLERLRATLGSQLDQLRQENEKKLEQMRITVDEKLQGTLERRLGESFKLVSERLERVREGLGEMRNLAAGVGDLKKVLTNVKTRGTWGEVQLGSILEQMLSPDQYVANFNPRPREREVVEYAVRLPGQEGADGSGVWIPIDAKFPVEDYLRLVNASEQGDPVLVQQSGAELLKSVRKSAQDIKKKYVNPPRTTDFAIMFLPTEGLYAEVLRAPGVAESIQREYRVVVAGPTTLSALLVSLQVGFRSLAIEKRSSEVWELLGAVKSEFGKFGEVLDRLKKQLETARRTVDQTGVRTRAIERKLKEVEGVAALPAAEILELPGEIDPSPDPEED